VKLVLQIGLLDAKAEVGNVKVLVLKVMEIGELIEVV